ncbi:MAG: EscU/YscU/HrcU family type III secretion system export apparatus switch protein [Synergistaceae bacterium]|jgi:flagellar biosynthesis protein|nr:EscU/YscU/HrcU family type III secretion system export apparatus switch protein [Synergistaceae bacterium]
MEDNQNFSKSTNSKSPDSRSPQRDGAVALKYDQKHDTAPVVTASGEGFIARRIVEVAQAANVPIVKDAALVSALLSLELGQEVPVELYDAVARVLAWIYKLDKGAEA